MPRTPANASPGAEIPPTTLAHPQPENPKFGIPEIRPLSPHTDRFDLRVSGVICARKSHHTGFRARLSAVSPASPL